MRKPFFANPLLLEIATYGAVVLVAAGLSFTHWAAPMIAGAEHLSTAGMMP